MPLQNPPTKSIRVVLICMILSILIPALALRLGAEPILPTVLGGVALLICLIILPIVYVTGRRHYREMQELVDGDHLAHWQLDDEEWQRFIEEDWIRMRREAITTPAWILGGGLLVAVVIAWLGGDWAILGYIGLITLLFAVPMGLFMYAAARTVYRKRQAVPGEIYIGGKGVLNSGSYQSWVGYGVSLSDVVLEEGERYTIRFDVTTQAGENQTTNPVRVPVPRGREEEAVRLVALFHGEE